MKNSNYETAVTLNDAHCPFQDERAIKPILEFIADIQPDKVFINGDMVDFAGVSRFSKNPLRILSKAEVRDIVAHAKKDPTGRGPDVVLQAAMQRELNETFDLLRRIREAAPKADIEYIFGNHEYRLYRFLMDRAPELYGLTKAGADQKGREVLSLEYLLRFEELGIKRCFSGLKESYTMWGSNLIIGHFDLVRKHSGWTAKSLLENKGISLIQGHTHRMGSFFKTKFGGVVLGAYENGCLCSLRPSYITDPDWQHGFCVIQKKKDDDRFLIQSIPVINHKFIFGNKEYSGARVRKPVLDVTNDPT